MAGLLGTVQDKLIAAEAGMSAKLEQYTAMAVGEARAAAASEKAASLKGEHEAATKRSEMEAAHASEIATTKAHFQQELSAARLDGQLEAERFQRSLAELQSAAGETDAKLSAAEAELSVREELLDQAALDMESALEMADEEKSNCQRLEAE